MAKIDVDEADVLWLHGAADAISDSFYSLHLRGMANAIESALNWTYEEIPGPDGQPDYVGPTYKVRQ